MNKSQFTTSNSSDALEKPGLYKIYRNAGTPLKVGISENLRRRLMSNHRLSNTGNSTLACHMELDESLTSEYNFPRDLNGGSFLKMNVTFYGKLLKMKKS